VLRWCRGLVVRACSGGLTYEDKARRCDLGRTSGSRPWSTVRILGRSTGPCCLIGEWGEQVGVVARVSTDPGEDQTDELEELRLCPFSCPGERDRTRSGVAGRYRYGARDMASRAMR